MFKVYDSKAKKFIKDDFRIGWNDDLFLPVRNFLKWSKNILVPSERFVVFRDIGIYDINGALIYEGDMCRVDDKNVGIVTYIPERASYVVLDYENDMYFMFREGRKVEIIGTFLDINTNESEDEDISHE